MHISVSACFFCYGTDLILICNNAADIWLLRYITDPITGATLVGINGNSLMI